MDLLNSNNLKQLGALVLLILLFVSCTPQTRYRVLSFFFDGVPPPGQNKEVKKQVQKTDSLKLAQSKKTNKNNRQEIQQFFHPPFADRECATCHDMSGGNRLTTPLPDLCFECHDDFRQEIAKLHGPVESGACTTCHHPHVSKNQYLLVRTGQKLCLYCHDIRDVKKNEVHEDIEDTPCTECHYAHGGDEVPFLK